MRAAVIKAPYQAAIEEVRRPDPGQGELLVKIEGCGVCASNMPLWEGRPWFSYPVQPGAPGHEGWGTVAACGAGVTNFREGDRVAALSYNAFADYDLLPANSAVRLPRSLDCIPFPGESVGCAVNVFRRSEVKAGETVAVIGAGFLGLIFTAMASAAGARVLAVSRREQALEAARKYGASGTVVLDDHQRVMDEVRSLAGGGGCDAVVEATGLQWPLDLAGELVRERGRIIVAGYHQDGVRQVNMQLWNWKGIDVVNAHERDPVVYLQGIRMGIEAIESGIFALPALITHSFPLDQLDLAYQHLSQRPGGFIKGVVLP